MQLTYCPQCREHTESKHPAMLIRGTSPAFSLKPYVDTSTTFCSKCGFKQVFRDWRELRSLYQTH